MPAAGRRPLCLQASELDHRLFEYFLMCLFHLYGLEMKGIPVLQALFDKVSGVLNLTLPWLFMYVGAMHFVLIILILAKCSFRGRNGRRKILLVLPVFVYNLGTALLLSGVKDSSRYFAYTFWLMPLLAALLLREEDQVIS